MPTFSDPASPSHDASSIVVVGASAGGVEALMALAASLPADFPAPVCVVLHMASNGTSTLARILTRAGAVPAVQVVDHLPLTPGRIYVARPDRHLVVRPGIVLSYMGPRENRHRPAVDPLFRSAAAAYGPRTIGVLLTGSGDDGTAGLLAVRKAGGVAVVQDPKEAFSPGMPTRAIEMGACDYCLPLTQITPLLTRLATERVEDTRQRTESQMVSRDEDSKLLAAEDEEASVRRFPDPAPLSGFSCPECGGRIWEVEEDDLLRFRCRVGHAYSPHSFLAVHTEALEGALWAALNALEESASLTRRLAERARDRGHGLTAQRLDEKATDTEQQASLLRTMLHRSEAIDQLEWEESVSEEERQLPDTAPKHVNVVGNMGP